MSISRKGATPYQAQLRKLLAKPTVDERTFSAATLAERFSLRPNEAKRTTINRIHQVLRQAWEAGDLVAYIAADGAELCEKEFCVNGSAAVEHPQIFGLPGAPAPEAGYNPISYQDHLKTKANRATSDASDSAACERDGDDATEDPKDEGADAVAEVDGEPDATPAVDESVAECLEHMAGFRPEGTAPEWLPDRLLAHLVTLPKVVRVLRQGLDRAQGPERLQLIRTGLRRKGEIDPVTARKLSELCRLTSDWWTRVYFAAVDQYSEWGEGIRDDDLPDLRRAPDAFWLDHETDYHPEAMVLWGIQLGSDSEALRAVAQEAVAALDEEEDQQTVTVQDQLRHRVATLDAEASELRRQLDDRDDDIQVRDRRITELTAQVEELRAVGGRSGAADAQLADAQRQVCEQRETIVDLSARLQAAQVRLDAAAELQRRISELERERDELAVRAAAGEQEHRLRERAETRLQEQVAEVRRLERELRDSGAGHVPVEDGAALMRALARPIGQAAEHGARRLAAGSPQPDDPKLLEFAAAFGQLVASLSVHPAAQALAGDATPPAAPSVPEESAEAAVEPEAPAAVAEDEAAAVAKPSAQEAAPATAPRRRSRRTAAFTVQPYGGAGEVGGSAIVVQTRSGHSVLLDAGQRVKGEYGLDTASPFHYSLPAVEALDAIVISHAHIDHIGSLPVLHSEYQRHRDEPLPVLMSDPTRRVGETMMRDSAKIQHKRQYLTSGHYAELAQSDFAPELDLKPAYGDPEVSDVLDDEVLHVIETRQPFLIPNTNIAVRLIPVAHVLGSCAVHLTDNDTGATLLYTGDLGPLTESQRTLPDFDGVNGFEPADVVIMESTYAVPTDAEREMRRVASREDNLQELYKAARKAAEASGKVLLPAFSLGRTQELLRIIEDDTVTGDLPAGDVYVGGMGERISEVYTDYNGSMWVTPGQMSRATEINRWLKDGIAFDEVVDDIVSRDSFAYIIVSPAMLSGGWSRAFLHRMVEDERHAVVFTGYLPRHGGGIRNLSKLHTGSRFALDERTVETRCAWRKATLSAHAPQQDLRRFAQRMLLGGKEVAFGMVHGSQEAENALAADVGELDGATATPLSNGVPWIPQIG